MLAFDLAVFVLVWLLSSFFVCALFVIINFINTKTHDRPSNQPPRSKQP